MKGKPLHKWEYKGKQPDEAHCDEFWALRLNARRCGFALVSYVFEPPALGIQRLISHNSRLRTCEKEQSDEII